MNYKLKKLLKNAYGKESPEKKRFFIQQIIGDPTWRRLHPISSFIGLHPGFIPVSAAVTAAAVCTLLVVIGFGHDKAPMPETPPDIITQIQVTTSNSENNDTSSVTTVTNVISDVTTSEKNNSFAVTDKNESAVTAVPNIIMDIISKTLGNSPDEHHDNVQNNNHSSVNNRPSSTSVTINNNGNSVTTAVNNTSIAITTSVYYSNLFRHDYHVADLKADNSLIYGYCDNDIWEEIGKSIYEENMPDDEISDEINFSEMLFDFILGCEPPNIVEGEITSLDYFVFEGKPWTLCEITLTEVYNFKIDDYSDPVVLNKGDKIKIAQAGGYMPVSQYIALNPDDMQFSDWSESRINSTVLYEAGSNHIEPKIGDRYLYMLDNECLEIPVENYYTRCLFVDSLQFIKNGSEYESISSDYSIPCSSVYNRFDIFHDPDSDRCIAFKNESVLLSGDFSCFSIDKDGKWTYIDRQFTDDGYYPFYGDYEESRDSQGRPIIKGKTFTMTWTDSGVILKCFDYDCNDTFTFEIK